MQVKCSWIALSRASAIILFLLCFLTGCGNPPYLTSFISDHNGFHFDEGVWSPDGYWFAAGTYDDTTSNGNNIYLYSSNGTIASTLHLHCLFPGLSTMSWLPDGRISCLEDSDSERLLITQLNQQEQPTIQTSIPLPNAPTTIINSLAWNPHHLWLAFISDTSPGSVDQSLFFVDEQGHILHQPIPEAPIMFPSGAGFSPVFAWSPDGKLLAISGANGDIFIMSVQEQGNGKLLLTPVRRLKTDWGGDTLSWSPSGRWLVCRHGTYTGEDYLYLLATDGSAHTVKLTSSYSDGQLANPNWSPDGKHLIVYHVDLTGGELLSFDIEQFLSDKHIQP